MCRLVSRRVKGKLYYYLQESFGSNKHRVQESYYIGSKKPDNQILLRCFEEFKKRLSEKGIGVVVPPFTDFIAHVAAVKLEKAAKQKNNFLKKLTTRQKKDFIKREKITFITDSNAIEGSALNFKQTEGIINEEERIEKLNKKYVLTNTSREQEEALSLSKCLDVYEIRLRQSGEISEELILQWHYILLHKIEGYCQYAGIWRPVNIYIRGSAYTFPHHAQVRALMLGLIDWYKQNEKLIHPVELAAKFHTKFTSIHPFADGNGRMARLLMNYILQLNHFPFTNIPLKKRSRYMDTQAAGNKENYKPFTKFLADEIILQNKQIRKCFNARGKQCD